MHFAVSDRVVREVCPERVSALCSKHLHFNIESGPSIRFTFVPGLRRGAVHAP